MATYRAVNSGTKCQMKPKLFEIKLHMVVALRAAAAGNKRHRQSFEEEGFLNLDDLIVHLFGDKCIALQMKHRQDVNKKKITSQELSQPKNDFSLWQLFLSYYSRKDDIEYIVAYTNGKFDSDMEKKTKSIQSDPDDPFQQLFGCTSESCEKFRQIDAPYHEEFLIDPEDGKWEGKGAFSPLFNQYQKEAKDTKEALKADFFKRLIFAVSQTSEEECEREIRALLAKLCNISNDLIDPFYAMWFTKMMGWVGTLEDVHYITADSITSDLSKIEIACLSSLVYLSFLNELKCTKVKFCDKKMEDCINMLKNLKCFGQNSERKHAVLRTSQVYAFTLLIDSTIQKAAENFPSPLFLLKTKHQEKLTRLSGLDRVLLVHDSTQGNTLAETLKVLRQAQPEFSVIVLTNEDKDGPKEETEEEIVLDDIECNDLSDGTLKMVLDKKVLFQGKLLSMKEIVGDEVGLRQVLDPETIEKIVSDKNIHIGQSSVRSKEPYIERRLTRADKSTTENTTGPQIHDARRSETAGSVLSEDEAVQQALSTWSHVVVTAPPGTGKSTLVPSIATRLKDKRPQLWVGVCDLGDNLKVLGVYQDEIRKSTSNNTETSLSSLETKLLHDLFKISGRSELEQQVFDQALHGGNLVLLIDSYDEIDFKYGASFLAFLSTLVSKKKALVWTMTREPHVEPLLKALGQPVALSLQNLKEDEQIELLTELLTAKNLPGAREPSDIAKTFVLGKLRPGFAENPLHLKMVSEIIGETAENGMDSLSLSNLYDKFVRIKFDKYYKDFKHNPRFDEAKYYDEFENEHIQLSVLVLLEDGKRGTLEIKTKSDLDYIQERAKEKNFGLLRAPDAGRPVFVHQTYTEYFLAVHLHNLLTPPAGSSKLDPKDLEMFRRVLIDFRFEVVRQFLNDKLHEWFPTDTQMVCCLKDFRAEFFETNLILPIINESLSSLLKLLFELEKMIVKHAARGVLKHFVHRMDQALMLWVWQQGLDELVLRYMKDAALMEVAGLVMQDVRRMVAEALEKLRFPDDSHRLPFLAAAWCSTEGWDRNPQAVRQEALAALKAAPAEDRAIVQGALCSWLKGLGKRPLCNDDFLQLVWKCGEALCPLLRKEVCEPAEKVLWIWLQDWKVMSNGERMDIDALQKQVSESPESFGFADEKEFGKRAKCCEGVRGYVCLWLRDCWAQASGWTHVRRMAKEALEVAESSGGLDDERTACLRSWIGDVEDVRFQDQGKLYIAIKWGEAEVVRQLLKAGVDLNVRFKGGRTFLHLACAKGHGDIVRMLLGAGCDANAKDDEGSTALHYSASNSKEHRDIVRMLLGAGCDANAQDDKGSTALHYSALSGGDHSDIVRMLLGAGCDANAQDDKGSTALHYCMYHLFYPHTAHLFYPHTAQVRIVKRAASGSSDAPPQQPGDGEQGLQQTAATPSNVWRHPVYVKDNDGMTPLAMWVKFFQRSTAKGWQHPMHVQDKGRMTPLANSEKLLQRFRDEKVPMLLLRCMKDSEVMAKAQLGMQDVRRMVAEALEKLRFPDDSHRLSFLADTWCSTEGWDSQAVRQEALAALKAAPAEDRAIVQGALCSWLKGLGKRPLCDDDFLQLVRKCGEALCPLLRKEVCEPAEKVLWIWLQDYKVMSNWERMDIDALQKQVSERPKSFGFADEKEFGKRAKCCEGDRGDLCFWLRDCWAQASGRTLVLCMAKEALEVAESSGDLDDERTACLRSWIGDVEDVRFQDQGKLYIAIKWGEAEVVRQLLKAGVDLNVRFEGGSTFLHLACAKGHGDIVRMLLGAGCDANAKDDNSRTTLHYSALSDGDHSDIVRMLLGAGCDATAQDDKGGTALHHSASNSHRHTTQMLIDILAASGHCDAPPQQPGDGEQALRQTAAGWRHPVYVEDKDGRTPLAAWAGSCRMGDERVPMLLLQCMKDSELMDKAQLGMQDVRRMVAEVLEKLRFLDDSHRLPFLAAAWCSTEGWDPQAVRQEALATLKAAPDDDRAVVLGALCPFLQDLSKWPLREGKQLVQKCRDALYALLRNEGCGPAERVLWIWLMDMRDLGHLRGGPIPVAARLAREAQPLAAAGSEENRVLEHWSRTRVTFESCFL